jgi:uncharacterized protein
MLVWADIENEPQVQYLLPVLDACRDLGTDVVVTARDYGAAIPLLESRGVAYHTIGSSYGAGKYAKVWGLAARSTALVRLLRREGVPDRLVCASRAAVLAARSLGIPSFMISDYEHANLTAFRWAGSTVLYPSVIGVENYRRAGFRPERLVPFAGLKEDITFAGIDLDRVEAADLADGDGLVRVLVRPPAEQSHYYVHRSREIYLEALGHIASFDSALVVMAPRYERQADDLEAFRWRNEPVILRRPVPFASLLKAVDLVLCSGGTMLREAAYLGVPGYSIFGSQIGAVDRYLETIGRIAIISSRDELGRVRVEKSPGLSPLALNPTLVEELARVVTRISSVEEKGAPDADRSSIAAG